MTCLRTCTVETEEQKAELAARQLDEQYGWLEHFVCEHGPRLLTRGMTEREANESLIACLQWQRDKIKELEAKLNARN